MSPAITGCLVLQSQTNVQGRSFGARGLMAVATAGFSDEETEAQRDRALALRERAGLKHPGPGNPESGAGSKWNEYK